MAIRTVPAGNGIQWITEAVNLLLKNPAPFAMMGLVVAVAGIIPILGSLALAILGPALYGGIAYAARVQDRGGNADFSHIGQAFQQPGKIGPMLLLCLPGIVAGLLVGIVLGIMLAVMLAGAGVSSLTDSPAALLASLGVGGLIALVLILVVAVLVFAITFFAIADVMFATDDAFGAMRQSLHACLTNIGAMLLYVLVLLVAAIVLAGILSLVSTILAQFALSIIAAPIYCASMYLAWKDIYGDTAADTLIESPPQDGGGIVA